jgi:AraC-like DNA-binding protein
MAFALERLGEGEDNLSLVAAQAGFADHAHLTRVATRLLGETPSSLRNAIQRGGKRA